MSAYQSPIDAPGEWTLTIAVRELFDQPDVRYPGRHVRGVQCTRAAGAAAIRVPTTGVIRRWTETFGGELVEIQPNPFLGFGGATAAAIADAGLPVFYLWFASAAPPGLTDQQQPAGTLIDSRDTFWFAVMFQDRAIVDPSAWSAMLLAALPTGEAGSWTSFHDRLIAQTIDPLATRPTLLLDHGGRPLLEGASDPLDLTVTLVGGTAAGSYPVSLLPGDGGDLQAAMAHAGAPTPPSLWGDGATSAQIAIVAPPGAEVDHRWVRWEDRVTSPDLVTLTPDLRHASVADLRRWFAPQHAIVPDDPAHADHAPSLPIYTTGNRVIPLIHGTTYYRNLIYELEQLDSAGPEQTGFHSITGFSLHHDFEMGRPPLVPPPPAEQSFTLQAVTERLAARGVPCRFLVNQFAPFVSPPPSATVPFAIAYLLYGSYIFGKSGLIEFEYNVAGGVTTLLILAAASVYASYILSEGGLPLQPSHGAVAGLLGIDPDLIKVEWAPHPATVDDNTNPAKGGPGSWFSGFISSFGNYHQKLSVVRSASGLIAYAGGIDIHPNRMDDRRHLVAGPYHDVHARVEGPAAYDLARTFHQRWKHTSLDEPVPLPAVIPPPRPDGTEIVQVARTYPAMAPSRALPFAPEGDFTIAESLIQAIEQAREYIYIQDQYLSPPSPIWNALVAAVDRVERLTIVVPVMGDQPLSDLHRREFMRALLDRDAGRGRVRVGAPQRRFSSPEAFRKAATGKCRLVEALTGSPISGDTIVLGPAARVPKPPFYLSVEGELMLAVPGAAGAADGDAVRLLILRGDAIALALPEADRLGATPRPHPVAAAATVVSLAGIYVHSKLTIIDDFFVTLGSANINHRGHYHDGELNVVMVPEALRAGPANLARRLRRELWSEHMDLPLSIAAPLVDDPVRGIEMFDRSWFSGTRFVPLGSLPEPPQFEFPSGPSWGTALLTALVGAGFLAEYEATDATVIDPTTGPV